MKFATAALVLLFLPACSGPEVPSSFRVDSPAAPMAHAAPRVSVAAVLGAANPMDANTCTAGLSCAQHGAPAGGPNDGSHDGHGGHEHHHGHQH